MDKLSEYKGEDLSDDEKNLLLQSMVEYIGSDNIEEDCNKIKEKLTEFSPNHIENELQDIQKDVDNKPRAKALLNFNINPFHDIIMKPIHEAESKLLEWINAKLVDFVLNFGSGTIPRIIGVIIKRWPYVKDLLMTEFMRQGLLVQNWNITTKPPPNEKPYTKKWYIRTLPPYDVKMGKYKKKPFNIKPEGTPEYIIDNIFSRDKEIPETNNNSCLLFPWFAQWFVEEFFKTGKDFDPDIQFKDDQCERTWSDHQIDLTSLYGAMEKPERTKVLRGKNGFLRSQIIEKNGIKEEYPLYWEDLTKEEQDNCPIQHPKDLEEEKINKLFVIGHPRQDLHPGQMLMTTIFLREHNRICKLLNDAYNDKDDDWFFNTTRNILTGLLLQVVLNDYVQHINPSKDLFTIFFKPSLLKNIKEWTSTIKTHRISEEFNLLYRWHPLVPDYVIDLNGKKTSVEETFYDTNYLVERGVDNVIKAAVNQRANAFGAKCSPKFLNIVDKSGVRQARNEMKLRSFNDYCKRYIVPKVHSFEDFNPEIKSELENTYDSINDLEFFVGVINQKVQSGIFPHLLTRMVLAHAVHGLFSNPLCQNGDWQHDTFDPKGIGYEITSTSNLWKIIARNTNVKESQVSFHYQVKKNYYPLLFFLVLILSIILIIKIII